MLFGEKNKKISMKNNVQEGLTHFPNWYREKFSNFVKMADLSAIVYFL
jgi:hypothetical protein